MNFPFKPSLQHMAIVKIARCLYYNNDIQKMLAEEEDIPSIWYRFDRPRHDHWIMIETLARKKLHFLPKLLRTRVVNLLRRISAQVFDWEEFHQYILYTNRDIGFENMLCWKMDGTIDFEKTARAIVRNINVDVRTRFIMACTYFMAEEILDIWVTNKKRVCRLSGNLAVRFWIKYLKKGVSNHWSEMIENYFQIPNIKKKDYPLRVSSFYRFLSQDLRRYYARHIRILNSDDMYRCLLQLNERETLQIFESSPSLLSRLLQWPFQIYLIDMSKKLWSRWEYVHFESMLGYIFKLCIIKGFQDFDYFQLFREFWESSPNHFREEVKRQEKDFKAFEAILNNNRNIDASSLQKISDLYFWRL